jgi:hypothetical protein
MKPMALDRSPDACCSCRSVASLGKAAWPGAVGAKDSLVCFCGIEQSRSLRSPIAQRIGASATRLACLIPANLHTLQERPRVIDCYGIAFGRCEPSPAACNLGAAMAKPRRQPVPRDRRANGDEFQRILLTNGWTLEAFCNEVDIDKRTGSKLLNSERVQMAVLNELKEALGYASVARLIHPSEFPHNGGEHDVPSLFGELPDWELMFAEGPATIAPNGLRYEIWKLRHKHIPDRFARGKCYDLSPLAAKDRARFREYLQRHPVLCDEIGPHPNLSGNITATPDRDGNCWWIIDPWIGGSPWRRCRHP